MANLQSTGDGDEVCDGGVTFKVQFQSAKFALWKINDRFQPIRALSSGRLLGFCLRKIVSVRKNQALRRFFYGIGG